MIIFLDIDGVLVHLTYNPSGRVLRTDMDPACIAVLNRLVEKTSGKIVISSTWRMLHTLDELREMLQKVGFIGEIISSTPVIRDRGHEILKWIQDASYKGPFLVIDDDIFDITPYKDIPSECIIHVKDGFMKGGLKEEHIAGMV